MLDRNQVRDVAAYVYSLTNPDYSTPRERQRIEAGRGGLSRPPAPPATARTPRANRDVGAPEPHRRTGSTAATWRRIIASVHGGRQGHMPTWDERLTPAEIKILALYVHSLGVEKP